MQTQTCTEETKAAQQKTRKHKEDEEGVDMEEAKPATRKSTFSQLATSQPIPGKTAPISLDVAIEQAK